MSIKLLNGTIDIVKLSDGKETLIIRGIVDPDSLVSIQSAEYQREIIPGVQKKKLIEALRTSTVPDIELGMRGERHQVRTGENGEVVYYLQDQVFVIDGLQRKTAAIELITQDPNCRPRIGAVVHLNTTFDWEAERFRILNQDRVRLNVNVLLRNLRGHSEALDMLYRLTQDDTFVLFNRVQWSQRMARSEILSAMVLCRTVGQLHSRFGPGKDTNPSSIASSFDKTMKVVGKTTMRDNVKTFFELLDECFGVKRIIYHQGASYIKSSFLFALAEVFSKHKNFWRGTRLFVEKDLRVKISKFAVSDPQICALACSSGKAREILFHLIVDHINSSKRTKKLVPFESDSVASEQEVVDEVAA